MYIYIYIYIVFLSAPFLQDNKDPSRSSDYPQTPSKCQMHHASTPRCRFKALGFKV